MELCGLLIVLSCSDMQSASYVFILSRHYFFFKVSVGGFPPGTIHDHLLLPGEHVSLCGHPRVSTYYKDDIRSVWYSTGRKPMP